jgi:putative endonuclease
VDKKIASFWHGIYARSMNTYFVYIATNFTNNVLYVGVTNNIERRLAEHKSKKCEGFTKKYNINKLVYFKTFYSPFEAIAAEKKIKGWLRIKKIKLIADSNPEFKDLSLATNIQE